MRLADLFSLDRQYTFYKAYHANSTNKRIHTFAIPVIIVSFLSLLSLVSLPPPFLDLSRVVTAGYIFYSIALDAVLGLVFAPFMLSCFAASLAFTRYAGPAGILPWGLAVNALAWLAQIVGHYVFEGRSPAFMDSLVQAFLAAPISVWLDLLFSFGFMPDAKARLMRSRVVAKARKAMTQKQQ